MFLINPYMNGRNWILKTGLLVDMTSNTAPAPFVASLLTTTTAGSAWNVFDDDVTSGITYNAGPTNNQGLGAKLLFGKLIRISKMVVRDNLGSWLCTVIGIKEDDSEVTIYSGTISVLANVEISSTDTSTPFKGIKIYRNTSTSINARILTCNIIEWYE